VETTFTPIGALGGRIVSIEQDVSLPLPSDDAVREHAYLVARNVRPLALIVTFRANDLLMLQVATKLEALAEAPAIPFVIDNGDGMADCGYASAAWVIDLFRWVGKAKLPETHLRRVIGLLLGYSVDAIARFEERQSKRLFSAPVA